MTSPSRRRTTSSAASPAPTVVHAAIIRAIIAITFALASSDFLPTPPPLQAFALSSSSSSSPSFSSRRVGLSAPLRATTASSVPVGGPSTFLFGATSRGNRRGSGTSFDVKEESDDSPLFAIPSIFSPSDSRPIVLFDGKCNLCNAGVQLVLDNDRASSDVRGNLRVAALQSRVGRILLARLPPRQREAVLGKGGGGKTKTEEGGEEYKSIVVAGPHDTWINSDACLRIGREMKGPLRHLALFASLIPKVVRDPLYRLLSKYRGKLFGKSPECRLWDDNWDTRFVDDSIFGGRGNGDVDPFADPSIASTSSSSGDDDDDDWETTTPGIPPVRAGDKVRVVSSRPILHAHVEGYDGGDGLCSVGLSGTVTRVLEGRSYPKNVAVRFELDDIPPFEAHFFPGQLRRV